MSDLIDRQEAIDAVIDACKKIPTIAIMAKYALIDLKPAQPEERTEERTETHACDCVSRQDAIDALDGEIEITGRTNAEAVKGYVRLVKNRLERLPSAQPERKTGKWNFIGDNMFECTSCGVVYTTNQLNGLRNYDTDPYAPKFCPNCGADMRGDTYE